MPQIEVYSSLSEYEAIDPEGQNIPDPTLRAMHLRTVPLLRVIDIVHHSLAEPDNPDNPALVTRQGQLVVHGELADTFTELFRRWYDLGYPIAQVVPISQSPDSSDAYSMRHNRTVCYRPDVILRPDGTADPSEHYYGSAVDVNPLDNPLVTIDHVIEPEEAIGRLPRLETILRRHRGTVIQAALDLDFEWGGDWADPAAPDGRYYLHWADGTPRHILTDTHHFEIIPELAAQLTRP